MNTSDAVGRLDLTLASQRYDHLDDLVRGEVPIAGVRLTWLHMTIEEIFFRFVRYREWHVSELSLAKCASLVAAGDTSIVPIPVFPMRAYRHSGIYIRSDGPVDAPERLAGGRIGVPEWSQTATVYARGLLTDEFDVPLTSVRWVQGGVNEAGRIEGVKVQLPEGVVVEPERERSLNDLLIAGEIDAIISARSPDGLADGSIVRLFSDPREREREFAARTGINPIMHVIVLRGDVHEAHPWVAGRLLTAFDEARLRSLERLRDDQVPRFALPWPADAYADATALLGPDPFPYGVQDNHVTLSAFLRHCHEQGVAKRLLAPEELFPESLQHASKV